MNRRRRPSSLMSLFTFGLGMATAYAGMALRQQAYGQLPDAGDTTAAPSPAPARASATAPGPWANSIQTWRPVDALGLTWDQPPAADGMARALRVPTLLYHHIEAPAPDITEGRRAMTIAPADLEGHLRFLHAQGWTFISLDDLTIALTEGRSLPEKAIALTFDDGWKNQYESAWPILRNMGIPAAFFLVAEPLVEGWEGTMSWRQLREMQGGGMTLAAHSWTHEELPGLSAERLKAEVEDQLQVFDVELGERPRYYAYPFGLAAEREVEAVRDAGYWAAWGVDPDGAQRPEDRYMLQRITVRGGECDSVEAFAACVGPWLAAAER